MDRREALHAHEHEVSFFPNQQGGWDENENVGSYPVIRLELTAQGNRLVVVMNGKKTVDVVAARNHMSGPFALQWGRGVIKFRKVQIQEL